MRCVHFRYKMQYSWLSLSRTRLSRITAYLEVKIWSLPKHENLKHIKISLTSRVQLHIYLLNVVNRISFSSILKIWYVEVRISRGISESHWEFEITRIDCITVSYTVNYLASNDCTCINCHFPIKWYIKKSKRKVQGVPQSQTAALPSPQEEEETDKSKQFYILHVFIFDLWCNYELWQTLLYVIKKVREKTWKYYDHKLQPFPDTNRKRKQTKPNKSKWNKRTKTAKNSTLLQTR